MSLDQFSPLPALSETERLPGADGGEAEQEQRVDDVVVQEEIV
jgi:hypothetical protein